MSFIDVFFISLGMPMDAFAVCHSTGTAAAGAYRAEGRSMDSEPALRQQVEAILEGEYKEE